MNIFCGYNYPSDPNLDSYYKKYPEEKLRKEVNETTMEEQKITKPEYKIGNTVVFSDKDEHPNSPKETIGQGKIIVAQYSNSTKEWVYRVRINRTTAYTVTEKNILYKI